MRNVDFTKEKEKIEANIKKNREIISGTLEEGKKLENSFNKKINDLNVQYERLLGALSIVRFALGEVDEGAPEVKEVDGEKKEEEKGEQEDKKEEEK